MAKSLLRIQSRSLRQKGLSVGQIANQLQVSKDSVSRWTSGVSLTVEQVENLQKRIIKGAERGRIVSAFNKKRARLDRLERAMVEGKNVLKNLTKRELLVAGVAIYAGEGVKKKHEVRFCNSDPLLINFMIRWLKTCFGIKNEDLHFAVGINEIHRDREGIVKDYWSTTTGIPLSSFVKTSFKKATSRKIYENFNDHYGTLDVRLLRSSLIHDKIMGLIHGLFSPG
jgi:predicted transcriptional regulator